MKGFDYKLLCCWRESCHIRIAFPNFKRNSRSNVFIFGVNNCLPLHQSMQSEHSSRPRFLFLFLSSKAKPHSPAFHFSDLHSFPKHSSAIQCFHKCVIVTFCKTPVDLNTIDYIWVVPIVLIQDGYIFIYGYLMGI